MNLRPAWATQGDCLRGRVGGRGTINVDLKVELSRAAVQCLVFGQVVVWPVYT